MCIRPDSTDVPTIYWRVNSSSLDGALLLDFITQTIVRAVYSKSRKVVFP